MVQPIRPAGGMPPVQPLSPARKPSGPSFAEGLQKAVAAADPKLERVRQFAAGAVGGEAGEVRLLESYDELSGDEALFEVQTSRGDCQVILSRTGALSMVEGP